MSAPLLWRVRCVLGPGVAEADHEQVDGHASYSAVGAGRSQRSHLLGVAALGVAGAAPSPSAAASPPSPSAPPRPRRLLGLGHLDSPTSAPTDVDDDGLVGIDVGGDAGGQA